MGYSTFQEDATTPLVVVEDLKTQVKTARASFLAMLFVLLGFIVATFALVVVAIEHSKEFGVVNSALTDKSTGEVLSLHKHEEVIDDVFAPGAAPGVEWITITGEDGSMTRTQVMAFEKKECQHISDPTCVDGYHFYFHTILGCFCATRFIDHDLEAQTHFVPVEHPEESARKRSLLSNQVDEYVASGYGGRQLLIQQFDQNHDGSLNTKDLIKLAKQWQLSPEEAAEELAEIQEDMAIPAMAHQKNPSFHTRFKQ